MRLILLVILFMCIVFGSVVTAEETASETQKTTETTTSPLTESDDLAFYGMLVIGMIAAVTIICATFLSWRLFSEARGSRVSGILGLVLESNRALQLLTVAAIIFALTFLGIANKLDDGVLGVLGALGGYVLGNLGRTPEAKQPGTDKTTPIPEPQ